VISCEFGKQSLPLVLTGHWLDGYTRDKQYFACLELVKETVRMNGQMR
jgi:hypothetical protein